MSHCFGVGVTFVFRTPKLLDNPKLHVGEGVSAGQFVFLVVGPFVGIGRLWQDISSASVFGR